MRGVPYLRLPSWPSKRSESALPMAPCLLAYRLRRTPRHWGIVYGLTFRPGASLARALREEPHKGVLPPREVEAPEVKGVCQGAGAKDVRGTGKEELREGGPETRIREAESHLDELVRTEGQDRSAGSR